MTPSSLSVAAHQGLNKVAGTPGNRPIVAMIRTALLEEGHKLSGNAIAAGAKFLGHGALITHALFAAWEGRKDYKACMED